jgi:hypothetical protein
MKLIAEILDGPLMGRLLVDKVRPHESSFGFA